MASALSANQLVHCHECGLDVRLPKLEHRQKAQCPRCGYNLTSYHAQGFERAAAFAITGLILLGLSIPFDFLSFSARGQAQAIDVAESIAILVDNDYWALALIQVTAIFVLPCMVLMGLLYLLLPLQFGQLPHFYVSVYRWVFRLIPWSMAEIFLIGALVSLIKITSMADVGLGVSFYAYVGFTLCLVATFYYVDRQQLWHALHDLDPQDKRLPLHPPKLTPQVRSESIQRTWALLFTATLLYIPANTLPIMNTRFLGQDDPSTILGGILLLWQGGSYPIAIIIFVASVLVPVAKLLILSWLNYSVQRQSEQLSRQRVRLYRLTEFIGRWSMVDVFVVAILVSLIQLGNTMSIYPGPAALAFCAVVVLTMLAAITFDARLIWQTKQQDEPSKH